MTSHTVHNHRELKDVLKSEDLVAAHKDDSFIRIPNFQKLKKEVDDIRIGLMGAEAEKTPCVAVISLQINDQLLNIFLTWLDKVLERPFWAEAKTLLLPFKDSKWTIVICPDDETLEKVKAQYS